MRVISVRVHFRFEHIIYRDTNEYVALIKGSVMA